MAFILYSKGLSVRDVSDVFDKIYGSKYSKSSLSRISQSFNEEMLKWRNRELESFYPMIMIDALYTKIKRSNKIETEAIYTVIALRENMTRDIIVIEIIPQESASGWEIIFSNLKDRGVKKINLVVADGLTGLEQSVAKIFPKAKLQKCVTHFKRNILKRVRISHKSEIAEDLRNVFITNGSGSSQSQGLENLNNFIEKWGKQYSFIKRYKNRTDIPYYFTYIGLSIE